VLLLTSVLQGIFHHPLNGLDAQGVRESLLPSDLWIVLVGIAVVRVLLSRCLLSRCQMSIPKLDVRG
jgi:hypothetical protein